MATVIMTFIMIAICYCTSKGNTFSLSGNLQDFVIILPILDLSVFVNQ